MSVFQRGLPTDLDIKRLREVFPDNELLPGKIIEYSQIAVTIGIQTSTSRFKTVTKAWRDKMELESGIILVPVNGQKKYRVCDDADKASLSISKSNTAGRYAKRAIQIGNQVNRKNLTEDQLKRFDCNQRFAAAVVGYQTIKPKVELPTL